MRYLWQYWCENLKRSFSDWERNEAIGTVISTIVSLWAGLGILQPHFIAAIPQVLVWAFPIWLLLLIFIITPARMWNSAQREKAELRQRLEPKLAITSGTGHPFVQWWEDAAEQIYRTFRVCVENLSDGTTVHDVRVALIETDPGLVFVPVPLHLMHDNPPSRDEPFKTAFDLAPRGRRHVDVFSYREDPSKDRMRITSAVRYLPTEILKRPYQLTIQATGRDVPDCKERFVIDIRLDGEVLFLPR